MARDQIWFMLRARKGGRAFDILKLQNAKIYIYIVLHQCDKIPLPKSPNHISGNCHRSEKNFGRLK